MLKLYVWFRGLMRRENGQDMIEYALIAALISIVVVVAAAGILEIAFSTWSTRIQQCITNTATFGSC